MEGLPRTTVINTGQHILIEGEDEENPYVAKVIRLFGDGESRNVVEPELDSCHTVIYEEFLTGNCESLITDVILIYRSHVSNIKCCLKEQYGINLVH